MRKKIENSDTRLPNTFRQTEPDIADERGFAEELKSKWEAQANGKPQKQKDELQTINRRLNELDRLIGSLYENFISGLLPEKQYKSLMKKYSAEQDNLDSQVSEIQEKLDQTKASSAHIRFASYNRLAAELPAPAREKHPLRMKQVLSLFCLPVYANLERSKVPR